MVDARRHVGTRRELSRIDVIIISRSIATRDGKLRSIIRSFPGTIGEVFGEYTRKRDCDVRVHNAYPTFRLNGQENVRRW